MLKYFTRSFAKKKIVSQTQEKNFCAVSCWNPGGLWNGLSLHRPLDRQTHITRQNARALSRGNRNPLLIHLYLTVSIKIPSWFPHWNLNPRLCWTTSLGTITQFYSPEKKNKRGMMVPTIPRIIAGRGEVVIIYIHTYAYVYIYIYTYTYIHAYVCICVYIYIYSQ